MTINELSEFTSTGKSDAAYRVLAYGSAGVGKSTFFSNCPGVYFLPTEEGVNDIPVPQFNKKIDSLNLIYEIVDKLINKQHPYTSVCLDNLKETEQLIIQQIEENLKKTTKKDSPKTIHELNEDWGEGYRLIASEWKRLLLKFDELREKRKMNVFLTNHSKKEKVVNLEGKDYEKHTLDLVGQGSNKVIVGWCDYVLFMRQDVSIAPESKHKVLALKGPLSIYTRGTASYTAKTRGAISWPDRIPLDWNTFSSLREHIVKYGKNLPSYLSEEFQSIKNTIPTKDNRRENAEKTFNESLKFGLWHICIGIINQAKFEIEVNT